MNGNLNGSQSLFYWITYSYFEGLSEDQVTLAENVSILILLDYLFL